MRVDIVPESLLERIGLLAGIVPVPIVHTMIPILLARVVMAAARLGVFESLREGPLAAAALAARVSADTRSTERLLFALEGVGYVVRAGDEYSLSTMARRWLTSESPIDLTDAVLHRYLDAALAEGAEEFIRTGASLDFHDDMPDKERRMYVDGQRAQARLIIPEVLRRLPLSDATRDFLDLGGGHGLMAEAVCTRHEGIQAVVMDLPQSLAHVDSAGIPHRVSRKALDIRHDELPSEAFDVVYVGNLAHHFTAEQNAHMLTKISSTLRLGGSCAVVDFVVDRSRRPRQFAALLDFYFALTSGGGMWSRDDFTGWLHDAGLGSVKFTKLRSAPGLVLITSSKQ